MAGECSLCGLPTPTPAVAASDAEGEYCCQGCLEVSRAVDDVADVDDAEVRERVRTASGLDDVDEAVDGGDDLETVFLGIEGMHCTTCEAFLGLRGESLEGIDAVDASYATDTARVRYDPDRIDEAAVPGELSGYGYTARRRDGDDERSAGRDEETLQRLLVGGFLAMLIMPWYVFFLYPSYVGIETGILAADRTSTYGLYFPMAIIAVLSGVVVFYTGWPIIRGAFVSTRARRPNMDLLLTVAILAAFAYSTVALATGSIHLYYDVAVAIVLVVTAGSFYEGKLKREATGLLSDATAVRVTEATRRLGDGSTETVHVDELDAGDEVLVRTGERVPVDGTVLEGVAAVDEAVVTGESFAATKRPGDDVVGGSVVTDDALVIAVDEGSASTLDRITSMVWRVQSDRPGVQRFADRLATVFVPAVLVLGGLVAVWRLAVGGSVAVALLAGLTVLVAACPCAMGLATPLAIAGGLRDGLRRGLVVTNGSLFETAPRVDTVVFDKTGTLTTGEMTVRRVVGDADAMAAAAAVEQRSSHPVAAAIVDHGATVQSTASDGGRTLGDQSQDNETSPGDPVTRPVTDFERHPGEGVSGVVAGESVVVGIPDLVERRCSPLPESLATAVEEVRADGDRPVVVGWGGDPSAVAVVGESERDDWGRTIEAFADEEVVVLTGDDESAAARFREHPGVDRVFSGVPPDGKAATVRRFRTAGTTAMVGDGTNDAPALAAADVGIAVAGTARAADAADVVLVNGSLREVPSVFELATATRRRIRENVAWAFGYNAIAIPLAVAGVLNPLLAAIAMATSSVLVVTNSRRRLL